MKRAEQLIKLSREHHGSLSMAKKISNIAANGSDAELLQAIQTIRDYNEAELEEHFQHEERTLFAPIFKDYSENTELVEMATRLLKEHGYIRMMIPRLNPETAREDLAEFGELLKNHTRLEERELFPQIEALFTPEQMDAISKFVALD